MQDWDSYDPDAMEHYVGNGATMLDDFRPGWWRDINLTTLDVVTFSQCVCGQLDGTWIHSAIVEHIGGSGNAIWYGFNWPERFSVHAYKLNAMWRREVLNRLHDDAIYEDLQRDCAGVVVNLFHDTPDPVPAA